MSLPTRKLIVTVQQHILQEQLRFPGASGEFSWLLSGITLATKMIQAKVQRAGLSDILGEQGQVNVQGEIQQKLDVYANEVLLHNLSVRESIGILASEENEQPITIQHANPGAKYAVIFDPLDGSSNIDVGVSVGTTFSILKRPADADEVLAELDRLERLGSAPVRRHAAGARRPRGGGAGPWLAVAIALALFALAYALWQRRPGG